MVMKDLKCIHSVSTPNCNAYCRRSIGCITMTYDQVTVFTFVFNVINLQMQRFPTWYSIELVKTGLNFIFHSYFNIVSWVEVEKPFRSKMLYKFMLCSISKEVMHFCTFKTQLKVAYNFKYVEISFGTHRENGFVQC